MDKILILGATSIIARELALQFARAGARLCLAARDHDELERIGADLRLRTAATIHQLCFDATEFASHSTLIAQAAAALEGLDGVVLCFGEMGNQDDAERDPAAALAIVNANYAGAVSLLTLAANRLERQGHGFIIVIGSVAGERGRRPNYIYGSAKGALALFSQGLRARLRPKGVTVMTVKLGLVDTRMSWGRKGPKGITPAAAAAAIYRDFRRGHLVVFVPAIWRPIMAIVRLIPERIFQRLSF
ncbi:MAG TPA: SDR family NAD(P)-dependent oxidoreductase [Candidatus Binataceae bacterium]|nr:SDR family NAD(P)-dependent oxidoreductase [Candidatus Binataceae bacterium]